MNTLKFSVGALGALILTGCAHYHNPHYPNGYHGYGHQVSQSANKTALIGWNPPTHSYRPLHTYKLLSDYAEQMTMKLVENLRYVTVSTPVAVASFVELDSGLDKTNILGNQLAESFITELQEFGISVVDYKTTGKILVNQNGDFAFSRNFSELNPHPDVQYVLSGTMTYNDRGVILNIRMVDLSNKVVVATSKGFIPHFVVESLHPQSAQNGLILDSTG